MCVGNIKLGAAQESLTLFVFLFKILSANHSPLLNGSFTANTFRYSMRQHWWSSFWQCYVQ